MGSATAVGAVPAHVGEGIAAGELVSTTPNTATGGILPLGLGGQTEGIAGHCAQSGDKQLAILPSNALNRISVVVVIIAEVAGIASHHIFPQPLGHLAVTDVIVVKGHLVGGTLIRLCIAALLAGRAHGEGAAADMNHPDSDIGQRINRYPVEVGDNDGEISLLAGSVVGDGNRSGAGLKSGHYQPLAFNLAGHDVTAAGDGVAAVTVEDIDRPVLILLHPDDRLGESEPARVLDVTHKAQTIERHRCCRQPAHTVGRAAQPCRR